jgi:hypothetical protein
VKKAILVLMLVCGSGCSSVKLEHLEAAHQSIKDERLAVTVRPGFEKEVDAQRKALDILLETMKAAVR